MWLTKRDPVTFGFWNQTRLPGKGRQKTAVPAQRLSKGKGGPVGQDYDGYTREKGWIWVLAQWQSTCLAYPTSWFRLLTLKERVAKARRYFWVKSLRVFKGMGLWPIWKDEFAKPVQDALAMAGRQWDHLGPLPPSRQKVMWLRIGEEVVDRGEGQMPDSQSVLGRLCKSGELNHSVETQQLDDWKCSPRRAEASVRSFQKVNAQHLVDSSRFVRTGIAEFRCSGRRSHSNEGGATRREMYW